MDIQCHPEIYLIFLHINIKARFPSSLNIIFFIHSPYSYKQSKDEVDID
jgi:hypothetical protein